jgi:hypothetical protein
MAKVVLARPSSRGIDTSTKLTHDVLDRLRAWRDPKDDARIEFILRYLPFAGERMAKGDLDAGEAADILAAGFKLGFVQHVRFSPWQPSIERGSADGLAAVTAARAAGALPGCTIFYDMEGPTGGAAYIEAYDQAWVDVVRGKIGNGNGGGLVDGGFGPGGYFGYGVPLTDEEMWKLRVSRYWRAGGSAPPEPAGCGWCMRQLLPLDQEIGGVKVDFNVVQPDRLGRVPRWLAV